MLEAQGAWCHVPKHQGWVGVPATGNAATRCAAFQNCSTPNIRTLATPLHLQLGDGIWAPHALIFDPTLRVNLHLKLASTDWASYDLATLEVYFGGLFYLSCPWSREVPNIRKNHTPNMAVLLASHPPPGHVKATTLLLISARSLCRKRQQQPISQFLKNFKSREFLCSFLSPFPSFGVTVSWEKRDLSKSGRTRFCSL